MPARSPQVIVCGGGLAGLYAAILLSRAGWDVIVLEKKSYPAHKVCGEYVSLEIIELLRHVGFDPFAFGASRISSLQISDPSGYTINCPLDLGAFGMSRFRMDEQLMQIARASGADVRENCRVTGISLQGDQFIVQSSAGEFRADWVIGSYGKRDMLDHKLNRNFMQSRSAYLGVKYHVRTDFPSDVIGLDLFRNGYAGIVKIENDLYNFCYLYRRPAGTETMHPGQIEQAILSSNPRLEKLLRESEFVTKTPLVISQISFNSKEPVEDHILMCGDAAGLITPLCGNGMAMAIHGACILSGILISHGRTNDRVLVEKLYARAWTEAFSARLRAGRTIQSLFGNTVLSKMVIRTIHTIPVLQRAIIAATHGKQIKAEALF